MIEKSKKTSIVNTSLKTERFEVLLLPKEPWRLVQPFPQFTNNVVVKILGYVGWLQQFPEDVDYDNDFSDDENELILKEEMPTF